MSRTYSAKKVAYSQKLAELLMENTGVLFVDADFVGSNQLQQVRADLRGRAEMIMGKNTQIRRVIRKVAEEYPEITKMLALVQGNCGLIFTNEDIKEIRDIVVSHVVPAAAKSGIIAPSDVFVPAGPTGLDPGQTSFFQALGIGTKIARGSIEILSDVHLIKKGEKVGSSEVSLLSKLNIKPFTYGLVPTKIYDTGAVYSADVLDITDEILLGKLFKSVSYVAGVSLALGYPTLASLPHSLANGFIKLLAISFATDYEFALAEEFKASRASGPAAPAAAGGDAAAAAPDADDDDSDDASDSDVGGGGLFGADSDSD